MHAGYVVLKNCRETKLHMYLNGSYEVLSVVYIIRVFILLMILVELVSVALYEVV